MPDTGYAHSAAGDRYNFGYFLDSDGIPIGNSRTRPVAGGSVNGGPIRFLMPKSMTPTARPDPTVTVVTGEDGGVQHRYPFDADNTQITKLSLSAQDLQTSGLVQNMPVKTYAGGRFGYAGIANVQIPNMLIMAQSRSIRVSDGVQVWSGDIFPNCQITYQDRDGFNERGAALYSYSIVPQPSTYDFAGFTNVDLDGAPKQVDTIPFENMPHPLVLQAVTFDGIITIIPTEFQPVSVAETDVALISQISGVRGAVLATVSSVQTTAPYGVTISGAPTPTARRGVVIMGFRS